MQKGLKGTAKQAEQFGQQFAEGTAFAAKGVALLSAAVTASAAVLGAITKSYANTGDELAKMSQRTGESVETLSEMRFMAKLADTDLASLQTAYRALSVNAFEAAKGAGEQADTFAALNIKVKDATGALKSSSQLMLEVSDRLSRMQNATERAAIAQRVLGKGGLDNLPLLMQGAAAMKAQAQEARDLGVAWSTDAAKGAEVFNDNLDRVMFAVEGVKNIIGAELLPVINQMIEQFLAWFKANRQLISQKVAEWARFAAEQLQAAASVMVDLLRTMHEIASGPVGEAVVGTFKGMAAAAVLLGHAIAYTSLNLEQLLKKRPSEAILADMEALVARTNASLDRLKSAGPVGETFGPPAPATTPRSPSATSGAQGSFLQAMEQRKLEKEQLGELFLLREQLENQLDRGTLDLKFDPKFGAEQIFAVKRLMELMPELMHEEARLLAIHNQQVGTGILDQERMRA
ncbi:MAG: hypothetical protein ACRD3I_07530, partial [Terriglobales bacterium]